MAAGGWGPIGQEPVPSVVAAKAVLLVGREEGGGTGQARSQREGEPPVLPVPVGTGQQAAAGGGAAVQASG